MNNKIEFIEKGAVSSSHTLQSHVDIQPSTREIIFENWDLDRYLISLVYERDVRPVFRFGSFFPTELQSSRTRVNFKLSLPKSQSILLETALKKERIMFVRQGHRFLVMNFTYTEGNDNNNYNWDIECMV
jgi:hypothetical protein